jgi:hypothetical protein
MFLYGEVNTSKLEWKKLACRNVFFQFINHLEIISSKWLASPANAVPGATNPFTLSEFKKVFLVTFYEKRYGAEFVENQPTEFDFFPIVWHTKLHSPICCVGIARHVDIDFNAIPVNGGGANDNNNADFVNLVVNDEYKRLIGNKILFASVFQCGTNGMNLVTCIMMRAYLRALLVMSNEGRSVADGKCCTRITTLMRDQPLYGRHKLGCLYNTPKKFADFMKNLLSKFNVRWLVDRVSLQDSTNVLQQIVLGTASPNYKNALGVLTADIDQAKFTLLLKLALRAPGQNLPQPFEIYDISMETQDHPRAGELDLMLSQCRSMNMWQAVMSTCLQHGCFTSNLFRAVVNLRLYWINETNLLIDGFEGLETAQEIAEYPVTVKELYSNLSNSTFYNVERDHRIP